MTKTGKLNECLHNIRDTRVGRLFSEMEEEMLVLEKEAEEAKKKVWCMEYRIGELRRLLDDAILTISDSYRHQQLPLKVKPGAWPTSGD